jgi:hypothetical protein
MRGRQHARRLMKKRELYEVRVEGLGVGVGAGALSELLFGLITLYFAVAFVILIFVMDLFCLHYLSVVI